MLRTRLRSNSTGKDYYNYTIDLEIRFRVKFLFIKYYVWKCIYSKHCDAVKAIENEAIIKELFKKWLKNRRNSHSDRVKIKTVLKNGKK